MCRYLFCSELVKASANIATIVHDDACHVSKFASSRKRGPSPLATKLRNIRFIADRFRARRHKDTYCLTRRHPEIPANRAISEGVNTSIAESAFSWLPKYSQLKFMTRRRHAFFVLQMLDLHNGKIFAKMANT